MARLKSPVGGQMGAVSPGGWLARQGCALQGPRGRCWSPGGRRPLRAWDHPPPAIMGGSMAGYLRVIHLRCCGRSRRSLWSEQVREGHTAPQPPTPSQKKSVPRRTNVGEFLVEGVTTREGLCVADAAPFRLGAIRILDPVLNLKRQISGNRTKLTLLSSNDCCSHTKIKNGTLDLMCPRTVCAQVAHRGTLQAAAGGSASTWTRRRGAGGRRSSRAPGEGLCATAAPLVTQ